MAKGKVKPSKPRAKKEKAELKAWLKAHKHAEKVEKAGQNLIELVAEAHGVDAKELKRLLG
jgi:hypothetical protein